MTVENLEKQLETWKQGLLINVGGSMVLMSMAIVEWIIRYFPDRSSNYSVWHIPWFVLQVITVTSGFSLLSGRRWRQLSLSTRLNTAFGYFTTGWVVLLALGLKTGRYISDELVFLIIGLGVTIGFSYLWLKRRRVNAPEEMFP